MSSPSNIYYLTGFHTLASNERESLLLIINEQPHLITDARYEHQVRQCKPCVIHIAEPKRNPYQIVAELIHKKHQATLNFEPRFISYKEYQYLQRLMPTVNFLPQDNIVEQLRIVKNNDEIQYIEQASILTDQVFKKLTQNKLTGHTEQDIALLLEQTVRKKGAEGIAFNPIVASNSNSALPHYQPARTPISAGPLIIDFGARYENYCADMTRTFWVGQKNSNSLKLKQFRSCYKYVYEAYQQTVDSIKPGMRAQEVFDFSYKILKKHHVHQYFNHALGHGVGLDIHENPRLSINSQEVLAKNMIFSIEPGVYIPGQFGIRLENTVLLTKNGCRSLNQFPMDLMYLN